MMLCSKVYRLDIIIIFFSFFWVLFRVDTKDTKKVKKRTLPGTYPYVLCTVVFYDVLCPCRVRVLFFFLHHSSFTHHLFVWYECSRTYVNYDLPGYDHTYWGTHMTHHHSSCISCSCIFR